MYPVEQSLVGNVTVDQSEKRILTFGASPMSQYSVENRLFKFKVPFLD